MTTTDSKEKQAIGAEAGWDWHRNNAVGDSFEKGDKHTWHTVSSVASWHRYNGWVVTDLIDDHYRNYRLYRTLEEALADKGGVPYQKFTDPDWATLYGKEYEV
jgi:hypothetical protein